MRAFVIVTAGLAVAGCDALRLPRDGRAGTPEPVAEPVTAAAGAATVATPPGGVTATAAALDTVPEAEKARAREAAAAPAAALGAETVSLGDPGDPGLWVKTMLVSAEAPGTVTTGGGAAVAVTLRPLDGAGGAQISLSALQALGLPLAGLHPVTVARAQ